MSLESVGTQGLAPAAGGFGFGAAYTRPTPGVDASQFLTVTAVAGMALVGFGHDEVETSAGSGRDGRSKWGMNTIKGTGRSGGSRGSARLQSG